MKMICFYLPQYHPIPENNGWWGKGFTDWVNVARAKPRFKGHYQPHIPADLGFYDLRLEETRIAQARMAAEYGIGGFCYYHYWFNGKMLLERPFNEVLKSGKPAFPFCLCWANENWTRTWDGQEHQVLMKQTYDEYDCMQHIEWLEKAFADSRYIKIGGRPLFLIYCPSDIPDLGQKISAWRDWLTKRGYPGLYVCSMKRVRNKLTDSEALGLGFDAIVEFQPNAQLFPQASFLKNEVHRNTRKVLDALHLQRLYSRVKVSNVVSYRALVERNLGRPASPHRAFPCVIPSWDNSPRRNAAFIIQNDDADLYRKWLDDALSRVKDHPQDERIVFINAWNEWAEGCHLEPDLRNGHRFLQATKEALDNFSRG